MLSSDAKSLRSPQRLLSSWTAFAMVITLIGAAFLIWPGDAPFMGDEPMLFLLADAANHAHQLADYGLMGSVGLRYGPAPTWIYQLFLLITSAPEGWIVLHVLVMFSGMVAGLLMMSRALKLSRWFIPLVMLSPYIWFFSRHLWDNSFLLPCSALAFGSYGLYLSERKAWALLIAIVFTALLPLIHFMALPLAAAIFLHMIVFLRRDLWRLRIPVVMVASALIALHASYIGALFSGSMRYGAHHIDRPIQWEAWWFPFFGGQLLSGWSVDYFFGVDWLPVNLGFRTINGITGFGYAAVLFGIVLAGQNAWKVRAAFRVRNQSSPNSVDVRSDAALIAVLALIFQVIVCGLSRSFHYAHYYNGLWIVCVLFAWLSVEQIVINRKGLALVSIYGFALVLILGTIITLVHQRGGSGDFYGPTIANTHKIGRAWGTGARSDVYSHSYTRMLAMDALRQLCVHDDADRMEGPLAILRTSTDPLDGRYEMRRINHNMAEKKTSDTPKP